MKIAVIGGGISGLVAAWELGKQHEVHLYEAENYLGGHTCTHVVEQAGAKYPIDMGFIVCNNRTYPNFLAYLEQWKVRCLPSEMSFSVRDIDDKFCWNSSVLTTVFQNIMHKPNTEWLRFARDIFRFHQTAKKALLEKKLQNYTIRALVEETTNHPWLMQYYVRPMISAIWSSDMQSVDTLPANFYIQFMENHGLLDFYNKPHWYVIEGGAHHYVKALQADEHFNFSLNTPVERISPHGEKVAVTVATETVIYDKVVLALHSNQADAILSDSYDSQKAALQKIRYLENTVVLHQDASVLPKNRKLWASWNYTIEPTAKKPMITYYMNRLQWLHGAPDFFVSLNMESIHPNTIITTRSFSHPQFNQDALLGQEILRSKNGENNLYFCGAYLYNGFHEDGVVSAKKVVALIEEGR